MAVKSGKKPSATAIPIMPFSPPLEDYFMLNPDKVVQGLEKLAAY